MKPWSAPAGWRPSRYRIDAVVWRWVIFPLVTLAILAVAAYFATFAARADDAFCPDAHVCFYLAGVVYNTNAPGQMALPVEDKSTGAVGWIAVDCAAQLALADSDINPSDASLAALCDTIGSNE